VLTGVTPQAALVLALIGFTGGLGAVALAQLWLDGRRRHERRRWEADERRRRLRPSLEPLLRAASRFERYAARWSPAWRPSLSDDARERAKDLADELDEDAEVAEGALRLEGAAAAVQDLRDLRAQLTRFRLLIDPPVGADPGARLVELGAVAAAITASLPDLRAAMVAELEGVAVREPAWPERLPVPAGEQARARPAGPAAAGGWFTTLDPLRDTVFRWLWLAALASQLGTWIQNVGAVDLMTLLAPTALLLALVQTATSLPGLALALPAGALADIVDRRRVLLLASAWMCAVSGFTAAVTFAHLTSSWTLLALTFALGVGAVAGLPAWQAIIPDLIGADRLAAGVTLSSVAINVGRAVGPAVGGLAVALAGPGAAFALSASAFAFTALVVLGWRREGPAASLPVEGVAAAVWSGIRYSVLAAPVRATLIRAAAFIGCGSALWALMPVVSRQLPGGFAGYGGLLGAFGVGAVAAGLTMGEIRRHLAPDALTLTAGLAFGAVTLALGQLPPYAIGMALMLVAGASWVCALSTFNVSAQRAAPRWVRGRVMASYQVAYMGAMAVGSTLWGAIATRAGVGPAMVVGAVALAGTASLARWWRLDQIGFEEADDVVPARVPALAPAAVAPRPRLLPGPGGAGAGTRLGPYVLDALIGEGSFGRVHLGRHEALDAPRAVKVMRAEVAADPTLRERFVRGAAAAARIRHPNVVEVYDCRSDGGVPYLVMERIDSVTLEEHLRAQPAEVRIGDPGIRQCVRAVAAALDHAHALGVVHGHLTAANVLLRVPDGRAVVSDFAVAPVGDELDATPAGDLRAFAALLYRVATGVPPYQAALPAIGEHPNRPPPPLRLTALDLPVELDAVLTRGLSAPPGARFHSAGQLAAAYLEATEPVGTSPALPALRPPAPALARRPARHRRPTSRVAAPAAIVLVGAVLLTLVAQPPAPGPVELPPPVVGVLGEPVAAGGMRLTVLSVELDAQPPERLRLDPADRFVLVQLRSVAGASGPAIASPYDWTLTDDSGAAYPAVLDGVDGALPEGRLAPSGSAQGRLGFVVPRSAAGLVLHFDAEVGDDAAQVPLG